MALSTFGLAMRAFLRIDLRPRKSDVESVDDVVVAMCSRLLAELWILNPRCWIEGLEGAMRGLVTLFGRMV